MERATDPVSFVANRFVVDNRVVRVSAVLHSPRLAVLDALLSRAECEALMGEAGHLMDRSEVVDGENMATTVDASRTSSGMHFERGASAVADDLQRRLMGIMGMPIEYGEPLQVLRYGPGEEYVPHFDFFGVQGADDPASTLRQHGQRVATLICYLSDVEHGGATVFPEAGLDVRPIQGRGVYFTYTNADGTADPMSLHGGGPVITGEKWIVTQWCRERPYHRPDSPPAT